jgi:Protein of unknown function (DUF3727)/Protein of unknown function (DUF1292)
MKQPSNHNDSPDVESVMLTDETGRSIECSIEYEFELEGKDYALLVPIDTPIDILSINDENDDEFVLATDEEIDVIFSTAKAVLAEYDLKLQRTALTLTVEGEIPGLDDEELDDEEAEGEDDREQFLWIASFYHEEQEYAICTPLDPFFVLARLNESGNAELLSDAEYKKLEPMMPSIESILEEQLFADLD